MSFWRGCCVPGCDKKHAEGILGHTLPTHPYVRRIWLQRIGDDTLFTRDESPMKHLRVCDGHFERACVFSSGKLRPKALPTLDLPAYTRVPGENFLIQNEPQRGFKTPEKITQGINLITQSGTTALESSPEMRVLRPTRMYGKRLLSEVVPKEEPCEKMESMSPEPGPSGICDIKQEFWKEEHEASETHLDVAEISSNIPQDYWMEEDKAPAKHEPDTEISSNIKQEYCKEEDEAPATHEAVSEISRYLTTDSESPESPQNEQPEELEGGDNEMLRLLRSLHQKVDRIEESIQALTARQEIVEIMMEDVLTPKGPLTKPAEFPLTSLKEFQEFERGCDESKMRNIASYFAYICGEDVNGSVNALVKESLSPGLCKLLSWTGRDAAGFLKPERALCDSKVRLQRRYLSQVLLEVTLKWRFALQSQNFKGPFSSHMRSTPYTHSLLKWRLSDP